MTISRAKPLVNKTLRESRSLAFSRLSAMLNARSLSHFSSSSSSGSLEADEADVEPSKEHQRKLCAGRRPTRDENQDVSGLARPACTSHKRRLPALASSSVMAPSKKLATNPLRVETL